MFTSLESQRCESSSFSRTSSRSSSSSELDSLVLLTNTNESCSSGEENDGALQKSLSEKWIGKRKEGGEWNSARQKNTNRSESPTSEPSLARITTGGVFSTRSTVRRRQEEEEVLVPPGSCVSSLELVERSQVNSGKDNAAANEAKPASSSPSSTASSTSSSSSLGIRGLVKRRKEAQKNFEPGAYITNRTMTETQERMNAVTVLPGAIFCLYFLLSGKWMMEDLLDPASSEEWQFSSQTSGGCLSIPAFPNLHAMPPLPVISVAVGIILHAPFSFVYHWHFCTTLPPGLPRLEHWSRRMDQAFIHVISTCMSYGSTGRVDYFFANLLFNGHCMVKMFQPMATPRKTQARILVSFLAYTLPFLRRGDTTSFIHVWTVMSAALWFFCTYPIGGWSHSAFHIAIAFVPPICLNAACRLHVSQKQIRRAALCAGLLLGES